MSVLVSSLEVEKAPDEKRVEAVCEFCSQKFTYVRRRSPSGKWNMYRRRYCCNSHRAFGGWRVKAVRKPQGRFKINLIEIRRLYEDSSLSIPDIAAKYGVHPVTVYRRLREGKIFRPNGARRIFAPLDKTVFVLAVQPLHSLDLEVELKEFLKNRRIPYSLKIYDKTYRNPTSSASSPGQEAS